MTDLAEHQPSHRLVPRRESVTPDDVLDIFEQGTEPIPPAPPPPPAVPPKRKPTIDELFEIFHEAHPEVMDEFVRLTRVAKSKGHKRIGGKMCFELIRWHFVFDREYDPEVERTFEINNVLVSRYVRRLQGDHPELADMFETRKLLSK